MAENNEAIKATGNEARLCSHVLDEWTRGREYVSDLDELFEDLYSMLRGERPEKNYDWQSNIVLNKVFQVVWTTIPYLTQKIFGASPIMGVGSFDKKGAWQREEIIEFWNTMQPSNSSDHVPFFLVTVMWVLRGMLNGVGFMKKSWHQVLQTKTIEKQITIPMAMDEAGNEIDVEPHTVKKSISIPIEDWPINRVVNNKDIVVDWLLQPSQSCRQGRFIIERAMVDLDSLHTSKIKYINLDDIKPTIDSSSSTLHGDHADSKSKDGQDIPPTSDIYADIEVYERQGKFPVYKEKKDGRWVPAFDQEKIYSSDEIVFKDMIITVAKAHSNDTGNVLIRFDTNPYKELTYIDIHFYLDPERWNSVGQLEPIKDNQTAINDNVNAMFDEIWQNLMPPVIIDKYALWDYDTMQHAPGQKWMVGGNPANAIMFKEPSRVTGDAWQKHILLDTELQLTSSVTPPMQGAGKEKAATTNVLNAQMSAGKLDFLVKMIEVTGLIPSAQMDIRFAKLFAHPLTFQIILGEPFEFSRYEEIYKYTPAAASVKLEHQKTQEIQEDIQIMQTIAAIPNPNTAKVVNLFLANILRNRDMPKEANLFDESYFEPQGDSGNMQMLERQLGGGASNQNQIEMSETEKGVRQSTYSPRGLPNG